MYDINRTLIQLRTWFRYFMMLGSISSFETGDEITDSTGQRKIENCFTNGKRIILNPEYMGSLKTIGQENFIACRMILALARRQHLMRNGRNPQIWNIACEQVVLNELKSYLDYLKEAHGDTKELERKFCIPNGVHIEQKFKGMSEGEVYMHLLQDSNSRRKCSSGMDSEGNPSPQTGSVGDSPSRTPDEIRKELQRISRILRSAETQAMSAGKDAAFWAGLADAADDSGPDPETLLHRFVTNSLPTGRSWKTPDSRMWAMGQYYPGVIKRNLGELAVFIDCSGSMDRETVAECLNWTHNAVQTCKPEKIHIVYFTEKIQRVDVFRWNEKFDIPESIPNGGTDFKRAMQYLEDKNPKAAIWLTDGYDNFPEPPDHIPVLWLMTTDVVAPYGQTVRFQSKKGAEC